jgi:hypothetical protein
MNRKRVIYALLAVGVVGGGTVSVAQADEPPNHANRLEATFTETNVSVTNRIADLGVFQLINTGTGTVEGLGGATLMLSATQDRSVHPCGTGSWTNAAVRRIVLGDGVLVVWELVHICPTDSGPRGSLIFSPDNGAFARYSSFADFRVLLPATAACHGACDSFAR